MEINHGDRGGKEHCGDGEVETVGIGVEELFKLGEHPTHNSTENEGENYLHDGVYDDGEKIHLTAYEGLGDTEGDRKNDKTYGIVESNDGQKEVGKGSLCLVLTNDHKGCGGRGCGCDRTEGDKLGNGELIGHQKMNTEKGEVNEQGCNERLNDTDGKCLLTRLFQLLEAELVSDRECDKAEGNLGDKTEGGNSLTGGEAETVNTEGAEAVRAYQHARNKICGNGR